MTSGSVLRYGPGYEAKCEAGWGRSSIAVTTSVECSDEAMCANNLGMEGTLTIVDDGNERNKRGSGCGIGQLCDGDLMKFVIHYRVQYSSARRQLPSPHKEKNEEPFSPTRLPPARPPCSSEGVLVYRQHGERRKRMHGAVPGAANAARCT
jgi:hypothetical protein